jgi:hypothetical protein
MITAPITATPVALDSRPTSTPITRSPSCVDAWKHGVYVCVYPRVMVLACVCARAPPCMRVSVCVCVCASVCARAHRCQRRRRYLSVPATGHALGGAAPVLLVGDVDGGEGGCTGTGTDVGVRTNQASCLTPRVCDCDQTACRQVNDAAKLFVSMRASACARRFGSRVCKKRATRRAKGPSSPPGSFHGWYASGVRRREGAERRAESYAWGRKRRPGATHDASHHTLSSCMRILLYTKGFQARGGTRIAS